MQQGLDSKPFCTSKQTKNYWRMTGGGPQELIPKIARYQASGTLLGASDRFTKSKTLVLGQQIFPFPAGWLTSYRLLRRVIGQFFGAANLPASSFAILWCIASPSSNQKTRAPQFANDFTLYELEKKCSGLFMASEQ